ncbi:MAG: single-stranded DNA-binding protein [Christensenellales bacterium]|jgi:hypothetical protein
MDSKNHVCVSGVTHSRPAYSHSMYGETFYSFFIAVKRLSGYLDILPVTAAYGLVKDLCLGDFILINGQLRSYNKIIDGNSRLILTIFAREVCIGAQEKKNEIFLDGYICKPVVYRATPFNREITDVLLAVNRHYNKSDYIPAITWGANARKCQYLEVGDRIQVCGRVQSREYEKRLSDGRIVVRVAYEVSISEVKKLDC